MMLRSILEFCIDKLRTKEKNSKPTESEKIWKTNEFLLKKYQNIFEKSSDLYITLNLEGIVIECNNSYTQNLGYTKDQIIGRSVFDHISGEHLQEMIQGNKPWKENHVINSKEIWLKRKDGTSSPALLSVSTIYDEYDNPQSNCIIKDTTEINMVKKIIKENAKFYRKQLDELKKDDLLKDEFMAMITHELKTPLFPILGYCEMLSEHISTSNLTSEQLEMIKEIQQNSTKLSNLIGDLLEAQKIEMGRLQFNKDYFDVKGFLVDLDKTFRELLSNNSIEFSVINNTHVNIFSDRERLTQVFRNIIENATDFVPKMNGKIEIGADSIDNTLVFYVKDNGIGIPKNKQNQLFHKFYQVDTSMRREHGGNGLGLTICKGIIEKLGGKIWVESDQGKGTTFYFSIPKNEKKTEMILSK